MKLIMKKVIMVLFCLLCIGCGKQTEESDSIKFKNEYEGYNEEYISLDISEANLIEYSSLEEINQIIESGTGVIYIGSPKDNLSRKAIDVLLGVTHNTDLDKIYYVDSLDGIKGLDEITDKKMPLVLFVKNGEIVKYHIGTVNDKTELSDDELVELYNDYLEGLQKIL